MKSQIVETDMHIRDGRVIQWVQAITDLEGEPLQLPAHRVAEEFDCHPNTARAIMKRLVNVGQLVIAHQVFRGGYYYKVGKKANHEDTRS